MPISLRKEDLIIQPRAIVYLLLFVALLALAHMVIHGNLKMAVIITLLPTATFILLAGAQYPMVSFILYCIITFYFQCIYRYAEIQGLSLVLDILLVVCIFSIIMNIASNSAKFNENVKNAINVFTVGQIFWTIFIICETIAPYSHMPEFVDSRDAFLMLPISFLICGIMLDTPKKLRIALVLIAFYVATATAKAYWQKTYGWDTYEVRFLIDYQAWGTHLLRDGTVRYFSFFSDAGKFGGTMGLMTAVFVIATLAVRRVWLRLVCLAAALLAGLGLLLSGTRGGMVVPFVGLLVYVFLSKNAKAIFTTVLLGSFLYCFFAYTDIGDDNKFIHRARTAFHSDDDISFNVRVENQKRFAYYLKDKPFGVGFGGHIVDTEQALQLDEDYIPTDSALVDIWVYYGIVGLCVYLFFMAVVILRCGYILLFKIRNPQLRMTLAGLLGANCGLLANAYVARVWDSVPCSLIVAMFFSFILNGPYIDKQMKPDEDL